VSTAALWKKIQAHLGLEPDGKPGGKTAAAVAAAVLPQDGEAPAPAAQPSPPSPAARFDDRSEKNIAGLTPGAQALCREWLARCLAEQIPVKVISGLRTYAEQAAIYAKGRTEPGPKVTNARPGYSWHNFGVAWDFVVFDAQGQPQWDSPLMTRCGKIAEELGLEWGGSWSGFKDIPHIQLRVRMSLAEARAAVAKGGLVV
jgi:peptidoglycan L-alanyl-D-glutamate endopeptidase CwlK